MKKFFKGLVEFLKDSRGNFSVFTLISLAASIALIYFGIVEVQNKHFVQESILWALFVMYSLAVLSDSLIAAVIEHGVWKAKAAPETYVNAPIDTDSVNLTPDSLNITPNTLTVEKPSEES
jgi:hypothetical protein